MRRGFLLVGLFVVLCLTEASAQNATTSPPPAHIAFVPHTHAHRLAKHPTLPVLYLGLGSTPDSKNLATFRLDNSGNVLTNSLRAFDDFFTNDGKNPTNLYSILSPIVLSGEKVLLLAATPASFVLYHANTNAHHVAAVALDDQGQPTKLINAFRTTHVEAALAAMIYDPSVRRLYLSYSSYWGWVSVSKDGAPSREFHMMSHPWNLWEFAAIPQWGRLYGIARGTDFNLIRLDSDGTAVEFDQLIQPGAPYLNNFQISPELRKAYALNAPDYRTITIFALDKQGRFTSVPRRFSVGETTLLRLDSKARRLYAFTQTGTIRIQPLDVEGYPVGTVGLFQVSCGAVRDAIVDESSGRVYVACTEPPK